MNRSRRRDTEADGPRVEFPFGEYWQPVKHYVGFRATVGDARVDCQISREVLRKVFALGDGDPVAVFKANREAIEDKARSLIADGRTDDEGGLAVRASDF